MIEKIAIDFSRPVPLFPLTDCVLLPHATVPLRIYEPRYRKMTRDTLDTGGLIAMAVFAGDRWRADYHGNPPIRPHVCVGYVVRSESLPGGRYGLLLQGLCRAMIVREVACIPYRRALVRPLESRATMEIDLGEQRCRIEALLEDDLLRQLVTVSAIHHWISREIPTTTLVDLAIMTFCSNMEQRYAMLAEPDACVRATWLEKFLRHTRKTLVMAERFRPADTPDGIHMN